MYCEELVVLEERRAGAVVLSVCGEVDLATAPALGAVLTLALRCVPAVLVVDLSGVDFLGAAGLAVLVAAAAAGANRTAVRVVTTRRECDVPILLTDLGAELTLCRTVDEAVRGPLS
jgi:anti-sigma B factor antagonist